MTAWEMTREPTTGYRREWQDRGRWRVRVEEAWHGWRWEVTKFRDTPGPRGEWHTPVASGVCSTEIGRPRDMAKRSALLILRMCVDTKTQLRQLARKATQHGYYYADHVARAYCPRCKERVECEVHLDGIGNRESLDHALTRSALTQLHAALEEHLVQSCEWVPDQRAVLLLLEGRHDG